TQSRQNYVLESVPARNRRLVQQESSGSRKRSTAVNNRGCKSVGSQRSVTQIGDNSSKMKKVSTVTPEKENEIFKKKEWVTVNKDSKKSGPPLSRTDAVHIADVKSVQETTVTTSKPKRKLESTREGRVRTKKMKTLESGTSATNDNNNNSDLKIETKDEIERVSNPPMQQVVSHDHGYLKAPSFHKYEVKEREAAVGEVLTAEGRPKYPGQDSTQADLLLLDIDLFYEKSSLNRSMLNHAHGLCQVQFLVPKCVGGTRWLSHMLQALEYLLKSYKAIVLHMQQIQNHKDSSRKAKNYLLLLTSADIVQYLRLLLDVVRCLGGLSELFQHGQTNISAIVNEIQTAVDVLNKYLTWPGPSLRRIMEGDTTMFQGEKLSGRSNTFKTARHDMLTSLISSLNKRFINMASKILQNAWILNFKLWPADYSGNEDFGIALKTSLVSRLSWQQINQSYGERCASFLHLVDLLLSIPASSADTERGFSEVKLVKTDWRIRLTDDHLMDLVAVQLQTESVDNFNPDKAIARFLTTGACRVDGFTHTAGCSTVEDLDDNNELNEEHVQEMLVQMQ
ncbi:hypothetical protein Hamer_G029768, partial [Homarus americanus]